MHRLPTRVDRAIEALYPGDVGDRVRAVLLPIAGRVAEPERVCWCVLFLADGDVEDVERHAQAAAVDPRDVMWWAEYDGESQRGARQSSAGVTSRERDECGRVCVGRGRGR